VLVSRVSVLIVALFGVGFSYILGSVKIGWALIMELSGGIGLVLLLRWYWWRINAWSEISAIIASAFLAVYLKIFPGSWLPRLLSSGFEKIGIHPDPWGVSIILIVLFTTLVWMAVTFLTPSDDINKLRSFFDKVKPGGWWKPVCEKTQMPKGENIFLLLGWMLSIFVIVFFLQGIGRLIFLQWLPAGLYLTGGVVAGIFLLNILNKIKWEGDKGGR
jgi:ABC-type multidrug transport system fused ATPase/permease subunit